MHALDTNVVGATVFRDGARVTRSGSITLDSGPQRVKVTGITKYAENDSFRVKGKGNASIASIDVALKEIVYEPSDAIKPIWEDLKKLEQEKERLLDDVATYNTRLKQIQGMMTEFSQTFGLVFAAGEGQISQLTEMDSSSSKLFLDTKKKLRDLANELEEVQDKIQILQKNIGDIRANRRVEAFYEVEVSLEVHKQGEVKLELAYQCNSAGWTPSYDLDLLQDDATLRRIALVRNRTEEDWDRISLVVSTATARPVEAVEPTPFYITAYDPEKERMARMDRKRKVSAKRSRPPQRAFAMVAPSAAPPPAPKPVIEETFAEASEGESGIAVYELPKPMTIPSDHEDHPVTLIEEKLESKTIHYWFADAMAEVVAQDEVTNGENVILPGKVKVFAEGDYIGETSVRLMAPREKFKIGTRTAYDVKAKKKMSEKIIEKAGITRGKLRRRYKFELEIESFSKRPIEIEVFDRIPHSLSTSIEVEPIDFERLGLMKEPMLGVLQWRFEIPVREKKTIEYAYEVVWDRNIQINPPLP